MNLQQPIVSVICPTTHDRVAFNRRIHQLYLKQDYPYKHLLFDYEDGTVGAKRNRLCDRAIGDVIISLDSDDLYKPDWITRSVASLVDNEADITGLSNLYFCEVTNDFATWEYSYINPLNPYVAGATMCYWKNIWKSNPFKEINIGEDNLFLFESKQKLKIVPHDYKDGFLATLHPGNTYIKPVANCINYRRLSEEEERKIRSSWRDLVAI